MERENSKGNERTAMPSKPPAGGEFPRLSIIIGTDGPGIRSRAAEALRDMRESGLDAAEYRSMSQAEAELASGGMFFSDFVGVVSDASDLASSSVPRIASRWSSILDAFDGYGGGSHLVMAFPSYSRSPSLHDDIVARLVKRGAETVRVDLPDYGALTDWACRYAEGIGEPIRRSTAAHVLASVDGDADAAAAMISMLGCSLDGMSEDEMRLASDDAPEAPERRIAEAVMSCDADELFACSATFPPTPDGFRQFLIRVRAALLECAIYDEDGSGKDRGASYVSFRRAKNPRWSKFVRASDIGAPMSKSPLGGGWARRKYLAACDAMRKMYAGGVVDESTLICDLCVCDEKKRDGDIASRRKEARRRMLERDREIDEGKRSS